MKLIVTSPGGCTHTSDSYPITVKGPAATPSFDQILCYPTYNTQFKIVPDITNPYSTSTKYVTIDYGDGIVDKLMPYRLTFPHTYPDSGFYQPQISVIDENYCIVPLVVNQLIKAIRIEPRFKPLDLGNSTPFFCEYGTVNFKDLSTANEPITKWEWDYGDPFSPAVGVTKPFNHFYSKPGIYSVSLKATSASGCSNSFAWNNLVEVQAKPDMDIQPSQPEVCEDGYVSFKAIEVSSTGSPISDYFWDFSNGDSAVGKNPLAEQFRKAGEYPVKLFTTDARGCVDTTVIKFLVNPLYRT